MKGRVYIFGALRILRRDSGLAALVFLLVFAGTCYYGAVTDSVVRENHTISGSLATALAVARGEGFQQLDWTTPEIDAFINLETRTLDWDAIPTDMTYSPAGGKFMLDRLYLVYSIGLFWGITGYSWDALIAYASIILAICATIIYGIFRLLLGKPLSFALALASAALPTTLVMLPALRELGKAPFILATILYCGYLSFHILSKRRYLTLSLIIGFVIGIGFGFRQDSLICLPAALGMAAVFVRFREGLYLRTRALGCALLVLAFLIPAGPSLVMTAQTGGNNAFYLTQGYSHYSLDTLDLRYRAYSPLYTVMDFNVHAYLYTYALDHDVAVVEDRRVLDQALLLKDLLQVPITGVEPSALLYGQQRRSLIIWEEDSEIIARKYVRELIAYFPAAFITRWFAAIMLTLRGLPLSLFGVPSEQAALHFSEQIGPIYQFFRAYAGLSLVLGFALLGMRNLRGAIGLSLVLAFFLGYPSLSFQLRHAFHLGFAMFLLPAFLLHMLYLAVRNAPKLRHMSAPTLMSALRPAILRGALFAAFVGALFLGPWAVAGYIERGNLQALWDEYRNADLEPLTYTSSDDGNTQTLLFENVPEQPPVWSLASLEWLFAPLPLRDFVADYLVVDLEAPGGEFYLEVFYDSSIYFGRTYFETPSGEQRIKLFIPVFSATESFVPTYAADIPQFSGIKTSTGATVHGVYRVKNRADFPFLLTAWISSHPGDFAPWTLN